MNWTKENPNKPGYYWAYSKMKNRTIIIEITPDCLTYCPDECDIMGDEAGEYLSAFDCFMGPVEIPKEPNELFTINK